MDYTKPDLIVSQLEGKSDSLDKASVGLSTRNIKRERLLSTRQSRPNDED